jgi:membrane protein
MLHAGQAWNLARRSIQGWIDDDAASMGAAVAYYTLLSLAPLLLVALAIAGVFYGGDAAQLLQRQIAQVLGESAAAGVAIILENVRTAPSGAIPVAVGLGTALLGASTVFGELQSDLDRIWRHPRRKSRGPREFLRKRLLSFGMVVTVGFLLLVSLVASAALAVLGEYGFMSRGPLAHGLEFAVSFVVVTGLFAMIYKVLPGARIAWGDVWAGAAVTSALFWIGKSAIGLYIGHAAVTSAFGAAGALVALLVWVYYSAQIFFLGAEFTREYALRHGSRQCARGRRLPHGAQAANEDHIAERVRR